jgi:Leucine-rich repeat (LRR) protein
LQPAICQLRLLEELTLSQNRLEQVPTSIDFLNSLTVLHLHENQLKEIPATIGNIKTLESLYLHGNQFKAFHHSFGIDLTNLQELSLEWFLYAKPPKSKTASKQKNPAIFQSLQKLC